jgi:hypothetical protein
MPHVPLPPFSVLRSARGVVDALRRSRAQHRETEAILLTAVSTTLCPKDPSNPDVVDLAKVVIEGFWESSLENGAHSWPVENARRSGVGCVASAGN